MASESNWGFACSSLARKGWEGGKEEEERKRGEEGREREDRRRERKEKP